MILFLWDSSITVLFFFLFLSLIQTIQFISTNTIRNPNIIKSVLLVSNGIFAILFEQFALAAISNTFVSFMYGVILLTGNKFRVLFRSRPTAAYSTSDLHHQRMFNITVMVQMLGLVFGIGLNVFGICLFDKFIRKIPVPNPIIITLLSMLAGVEIIRSGWVLFSHRQTIVYLMMNHLKGWKEGKLKRYF